MKIDMGQSVELFPRKLILKHFLPGQGLSVPKGHCLTVAFNCFLGCYSGREWESSLRIATQLESALKLSHSEGGVKYN